jgi:hypothetical protein
MRVQWESRSAIYEIERAHDSFIRDIFYNILIEFGTSKNLVTNSMDVSSS